MSRLKSVLRKDLPRLPVDVLAFRDESRSHDEVEIYIYVYTRRRVQTPPFVSGALLLIAEVARTVATVKPRIRSSSLERPVVRSTSDVVNSATRGKNRIPNAKTFFFPRNNTNTRLVVAFVMRVSLHGLLFTTLNHDRSSSSWHTHGVEVYDRVSLFLYETQGYFQLLTM